MSGAEGLRRGGCLGGMNLRLRWRYDERAFGTLCT